MSTRVLLVSRGMFHDGFVRVMEDRSTDVEIIGAAESWTEAKAMMDEVRPDALVADYQFAEEMMADLEQLAADDDSVPDKILFVILDENKVVIYQRRQITDITVDRLLEVL